MTGHCLQLIETKNFYLKHFILNPIPNQLQLKEKLSKFTFGLSLKMGEKIKFLNISQILTNSGSFPSAH